MRHKKRFRLAPPLPITGTTEGTLPDPFTLDTMTHLATSLQTLAEAVEELGWPQGLAPPASISSSVDSSPTPLSCGKRRCNSFSKWPTDRMSFSKTRKRSTRVPLNWPILPRKDLATQAQMMLSFLLLAETRMYTVTHLPWLPQGRS